MMTTAPGWTMYSRVDSLTVGQANTVTFDVQQPALEDGFAGEFGFGERGC